MKRLLTALLRLTLIFALHPAGVQAQGSLAPGLRHAVERLDVTTAAELAKDNAGSITIGVVSGKELVWTKSYGYADAEKKRPATRDTLYRIGSITKQFTGLMLLQLAEEGKVRLSDPVEKYFPEVNKVQGSLPGAPPITLLQLATHTSGLGREPDDVATYVKGPVSDWERVLIAALPKTKYIYEPGTIASYSNIGYAILGAASGRAAGKSYVDYVSERIFLPLGMTYTAFEPNDRIRSNIAKGYAVIEGKVNTELAESEHQGRGYKVPNGAIYTTVGDLARFMAFELGEGPVSVFKHETLNHNFERIYSANGKLGAGYGIGFLVDREGDLIAFGHSGAVAGYQASALFDRSSNIGVIVLSNIIGGAVKIEAIALQALQILAAAGRVQATPK